VRTPIIPPKNVIGTENKATNIIKAGIDAIVHLTIKLTFELKGI